MVKRPVVDRERLQRAVAAAEAAVREGPYPSAVFAVADSEAMLLTHAISQPQRAPAHQDSIFLLASITKPIVATAIMRLVEEGRLLLSPAAIEMMARLHTAGLIDSFDRRPAHYGLGWGKPSTDGATLASTRAYSHGGATGTLLHIDPEWNLVFVFLTNSWGIEGSAPNLVLNAVYGALRCVLS